MMSVGSDPARLIAYRGGEAHVEGVALSRIAAEIGTPCFVYSRTALVDIARVPPPTVPCAIFDSVSCS